MFKKLSWFVALTAAACAGQTRVEEPQPTPTTAPAATAAPTAEPVAEPVPEPSAEPVAEPAPSADAGGKKPAPPPSGRPAIQIGPQKKIDSTFGSTPASILKLKTATGDVTLKLGEYALRTGTNILFEVGAKYPKGKAAAIGDLVHLRTQVGDSTRFAEVESYSVPFVVVLPSKKSLNLAIGTIELDDAGQETTKIKSWRVVAPTRFDEGLSQVVFELDRIGPSILYATPAEPTEKPSGG